MQTTKEKFILFFVVILASALTIFSFVEAGSLTPPGTPNVTMYTLNDIYNKLEGISVTVHTGLDPASGPAGTMHTLQDIYNAIPSNDKICFGTNGGTAPCVGVVCAAVFCQTGYSCVGGTCVLSQ